MFVESNNVLDIYDNEIVSINIYAIFKCVDLIKKWLNKFLLGGIIKLLEPFFTHFFLENLWEKITQVINIIKTTKVRDG